MGEGWQLFKIIGIPLRIQPTWLFAVAIFTTLFQPRYAASVEPAALSWGLALLTTLLLFTSVLLHELGSCPHGAAGGGESGEHHPVPPGWHRPGREGVPYGDGKPSGLPLLALW